MAALGMIIYAVCTALTMLTKILVEETERTIILWFLGSFTRHSKQRGRTTRTTSDKTSATYVKLK